MKVRVENLVADPYERDFLGKVPFDPESGRGEVMGLIGRLKYEESIPEGVSRHPEGKPYLTCGVTASERVEILKRLWRVLYPHRENGNVAQMFGAVNTEVSENSIDMISILAREEELAAIERQEREQRLARYRERLREDEEEERRLDSLDESEDAECVPAVQEGPLTPEQILAGASFISVAECLARELHMTVKEDGLCAYCGQDRNAGTGVEGEDEEETDGDFEAIIGSSEQSVETFECDLCDKTFPVSLCHEVDGGCVCPSCFAEGYSDIS